MNNAIIFFEKEIEQINVLLENESEDKRNYLEKKKMYYLYAISALKDNLRCIDDGK